MGAEPENPINPIYGISMLNWLIEKIKPDRIEITEPDAEDWGWYSYAEWKGQTYLVGAVGLESEEDDLDEWILQVSKERSFLEALTFKNKIEETDGFLKYLE